MTEIKQSIPFLRLNEINSNAKTHGRDADKILTRACSDPQKKNKVRR